MSDSPQQDNPGTPSSGTQVPQAQPAAGQGPESHNLPTMGQVLDGRQQPQGGRDYEASYKGLNDWVVKEFNTLRQTVTQMAQAMQTLAQQPQAGTPAPAPVSGGKAAEPAQDEGLSVLDQAIQAKKAEQYRDLLIGEYEAATGLPISSFRQHIAVVPPALGPDGKLDDSGQRNVIDSFVKGLQGLQKKTESAVLAGSTPGAAPGAPAEDSGDAIYQRFLDVARAFSAPDFDNLPKDKQAEIERVYFELAANPEVQERHQGNLQPAMNANDLTRMVRELSQQVARLEGRTPSAKMM